MNIKFASKNYFAILFLIFLSLSIYLKAVNGPYVIDDYPNLVSNKSLLIKDFNIEALQEAALSSPSSKFHRPLSMLTFAFNYSMAGNMDAFSIKFTNILIHVLTGLGIYFLTLLIYPLVIGRDKIIRSNEVQLVSICTASFWLLHPFFVSTVLYSIQRMTMLSCLSIVYCAIFYIGLRKKIIEDNSGYFPVLGLILLGTVIAFLFKENGALLPGFLLLIEIFCLEFKFHSKTPRWAKSLVLICLISPVFIIFCFLAYNYFNFNQQAMFHFGFSIHERLLSETRILWSYIGWLVYANPLPMSLVNDDWEISRNLLTPITTLFALLSWITVIIAATFIYIKKKLRIYLFCVLWFLYGHILESTVLPLTMVFEHRNYLPGYGIILLFVSVVFRLLFRSTKNEWVNYVIIVYLFLILPVYLLNERVSQWSTSDNFIISTLNARPNSSWAWVITANHIKSEDHFENSISVINQLQQTDKNNAAHVFNEAILHCFHRNNKRFSRALISKLRNINFDYVHNASSLLSFRAFATQCAGSQINLNFIIEVYEAVMESDNQRVIMYIPHAVKLITDKNRYIRL